MELYPNPASERLQIHLNKATGKEINYSIYDISGKPMRYGQVRITEKFDLDTKSLPNGIYFLELRSEDIVRTKKFVISH